MCEAVRTGSQLKPDVVLMDPVMPGIGWRADHADYSRAMPGHSSWSDDQVQPYTLVHSSSRRVPDAPGRSLFYTGINDMKNPCDDEGMND